MMMMLQVVRILIYYVKKKFTLLRKRCLNQESAINITKYYFVISLFILLQCRNLSIENPIIKNMNFKICITNRIIFYRSFCSLTLPYTIISSLLCSGRWMNFVLPQSWRPYTYFKILWYVIFISALQQWFNIYLPGPYLYKIYNLSFPRFSHTGLFKATPFCGSHNSHM